MRREQRFTDGRSPLEHIGLQTLLLGMDAYSDELISMLVGRQNDVRRELGLKLKSVVIGDEGREGAVIDVPTHRAQRVAAPVEEQRRPGGPSGPRPGMGVMWKLRSAVLAAAGMEGTYKGFPSADLVLTAMKRIKRKGGVVPDEAAVVAGLRRRGKLLMIAAPEPPQEVPAKKPRHKITAAMRKTIGRNSRRRWAEAKRLGVENNGHLPSDEQLAKARKKAAKAVAKTSAVKATAKAASKPVKQKDDKKEEAQRARVLKEATDYLHSRGIKLPKKFAHRKQVRRKTPLASAETSVTIPAASAASVQA